MGRLPCCDDNGLKKGPWTQEEDEKLTSYIQKHGHGSWRSLPKNAGLNRCGKSCRLRWTNYLRPDIKRGRFSEEEEQMIIKLHSILGNKWSRIAARLPGRTDNEIKNYWNTHLRKKLLQMGIDPVTHRPRTDLSLLSNISQLLSLPMTSNKTIMNSYPYDPINALSLQSNAAELAKLQVLNNIIQILHTSPNPSMDCSSAALLGLSNTQLINNYNTPMNISGVFDVGVPSSSLSASLPTRSETEPCGVFDSWGGSGNGSQEMMEMKNYDHQHVRSGGHGAPAQDKLPGLVSASSTDQGVSSVNGNLTSNTNSTNGSMESLPDYDFLDGWDKLIDDGTSDFFWKDLLN